MTAASREWAAEALQVVLAAPGARDNSSRLAGSACACRYRSAGVASVGLLMRLTRHRPERDTSSTRGLSVDGKAVRGAIAPDGRAVHLVTAMPHEVPAVLTQRHALLSDHDVALAHRT